MKTKKRVILGVIIILILGITFGVYFLKNNNENIETETEIIEEETEEDVPEVTKSEQIIKLEEYQKENSDVIGWLKIPNTSINYPVLQAEDNDYYMKKNYLKEYDYDGSIFLDKDYDWNLPSSNLLIYGHNNLNGKMFQELLKYKDKDYYNEHPTINFTTSNEESEFEIIAVFYSRVYYKSEKNVFRYYYFINANNKNEFDEYVENSLKASIYETGKTAEYGDQLMTLSTCSYHTEDGRFVVVAKKNKK